MEKEELYRVLIELDVTATDEIEALELAVGDIFELQAAGDLDAVVTRLSDVHEPTTKGRNFATAERMIQIANDAIDNIGETMSGRSLYDELVGTFNMSDEEILAAGFSVLKEFMNDKGDRKEEDDG